MIVLISFFNTVIFRHGYRTGFGRRQLEYIPEFSNFYKLERKAGICSKGRRKSKLSNFHYFWSIEFVRCETKMNVNCTLLPQLQSMCCKQNSRWHVVPTRFFVRSLGLFPSLFGYVAFVCFALSSVKGVVCIKYGSILFYPI